MKKICIVLMIFIIVIGLTGCSDEYLSVVQDRVEENQEVARLTMESDHLIRGYMVSEDGIAVKIVQIFEFAYDGDPYQMLVEIDPMAESFLGLENLSGEDTELIKNWQQELIELELTEEIPTLGESDLEVLWTAAVEEAKANVLFLVKEK